MRWSDIIRRTDEDCTCQEPVSDGPGAFSDDDEHNYTQMTDEMFARIKSGEHYLEVINDLARQYAQMHGNSHDAHDFAHDALSRRAWEMGLWPRDEADGQ